MRMPVERGAQLQAGNDREVAAFGISCRWSECAVYLRRLYIQIFLSGCEQRRRALLCDVLRHSAHSTFFSRVRAAISSRYSVRDQEYANLHTQFAAKARDGRLPATRGRMPGVAVNLTAQRGRS